MAKPRIFVSSTYYDLRHIRKSIETFIDGLGYEPILFESGSIPFSHETPLDESCYKEIGGCHILVLILGGRFGSPASDAEIKLSDDDLERQYQHYNSITEKEFQTALAADIPVYIFVESSVASEYDTYKENIGNTSIRYAHAKSVNIFRLLDQIHAQRRNNLIRNFSHVDDIVNWLRDQWSGLFADFLSNRSRQKPLANLQAQLSRLSDVTEALKGYVENIVREVAPDKQEAEELIQASDKELSKKAIKLEVMANPVVKVLIDRGADAEKLFDALNGASNLDDLKVRLTPDVVGENNSFLTRALSHDPFWIINFNSAREVLGQPQFILPKKGT